MTTDALGGDVSIYTLALTVVTLTQQLFVGLPPTTTVNDSLVALDPRCTATRPAADEGRNKGLRCQHLR